VLHKKRFTSMTLVNPVIGSFSHDNLDQADGTGVMSNSMQILYETVIYKAGVISRDAVKGFATINYDQSPSPLSILGGGTNSIFGPGGIVDGVGSVIKNYKQGNILGAILGASNTYNNAKKIKKSNVKQELKGIAKKGVLEIGKQSSNITNPIARFTVGATAIANASSISQLAGTADNKDKANSRVIKQSNVDTVNFLGESESFNLVSNDENVRDEVAAALYFRDVGSRKGLTIAQSNIEYEGSSDNIKSVYSNKAITDMRKLVTEGYIKIPRESKDVQIVVEKVTI